jgi:hypothetical protein
MESLTLNRSNVVKEKADYIIMTCKSVNKDLNYAIDIIEWYSNSRSEDKEIAKYIFENWNK